MHSNSNRGKPTQSGNPHELTIKQHVLPKVSIERFAGADGAVDCCMVATDSVVRLRPGNVMFCANRAWNHHAEAGPTTRHVEDEFQVLARRVLSGERALLDPALHLVATKFFALVIVREQLRDSPPGDIAMPNRTGGGLTLDEQERAEKSGYFFVSEGGIFESRMAAGAQIQGQITWAVRNWSHWRWGVVRSPGPQFIVPDTIQPQAFIPIGPRVLLGANCPNGDMSHADVELHNRNARAAAKRYYFAHDLRQTSAGSE